MKVNLSKVIKREKNKKIEDQSKKDGEKVASYLLPMLKKVSDEVAFDKAIKENFYEAPLIIKTYLEVTIRLISSFGFNNKNIIAPLTLLPIAFFLYKKEGKNIFDSTGLPI